MGFSLSGGPQSSTSSTTNNRTDDHTDNSQSDNRVIAEAGAVVSSQRTQTEAGRDILINDNSHHTGLDPAQAFSAFTNLTDTLLGGVGRVIETVAGTRNGKADSVPRGEAQPAPARPAAPGILASLAPWQRYTVFGFGALLLVLIPIAVFKRGRRA